MAGWGRWAVLGSILLGTAACEESVTEPGGGDDTLPGTVLVLEDNGTQDSLYTILAEAGFEVTSGGLYSEFDGTDLDQYGAIIFLNGVHWTSTMPDSVQQDIRDYVAGGGNLLTTEWLLWSGAVNATITSMLPVDYGGTWNTGSETYTLEGQHPIATGLPASFTVPDQWSFSVTTHVPTDDALVVFSGSRSGDAVVVGRHGEGTVVHWNMGGQYAGPAIWSPEVRTLLRNIVGFLTDPDS